jgi:Xaa-Pro aminopeptidase
MLVTREHDHILSDTRYSTQLKDECDDLKVEIRDATSTTIASLASLLKSTKTTTLRFESDSLTKSQFDQLESELLGVELVASCDEVECLRSIKDKSEIKAIRESIAVNQKAFSVIRSQLRAEQTELEIAHNLEHQMRLFGARGFAFEPIIGVGARSALPHGHPTNKQVGESAFLLFDWGANVNHYLSDLTRVLVTAKIPPKLRKIYDIVLKAQLAAIKKIRPGVELKTVDQAARKVIEDSGFGKNFGHGLGHSFGLEIHETPFMSPIFDGKLQAGMVITVEPGIYLPGWGGVRIEDDILVTQNGHEVLSDLPKQLDECTVQL